MITYLALGDSYTIGEQVPIYDSFPYQLVQLLRKQSLDMAAAEIVAKTGWTTDELAAGIRSQQLMPAYGFVTLLIGVNNQYRGRDVEEYKTAFQQLLEQAIDFAQGDRNRVFVISIPDWGVTPFAAERNANEIALQIDSYNNACRIITESLHCDYTDITTAQRTDGRNPDFLAADGLHPSGKEYAKWATLLAPKIAAVVK